MMPPHAALRQVRQLRQVQRSAKQTRGRRGLSVVIVFQLMILITIFLSWVPVLQLVTASAATTVADAGAGEDNDAEHAPGVMEVEIGRAGDAVLPTSAGGVHDAASRESVRLTSAALHVPPSLLRGNFSVISINKDLGDLGFSGLTNQRCCFFSIINQAVQLNAVIDVSTIRYRGAWNETDSIRHDELYDIDAWNAYVSEHPRTLPYLVRSEDIADNHNIKRTTVAAASIRLELAFVDSYMIQDARLKELALHFYRAIRPSRGVQKIIDGLQPSGDYGAIHLRVEEDLKTANGFWERRVSVPQIWKRIKESEAISRCVERHSGLLDVFVAVSIGDVKDEDDLALLMGGKGPFEGSRILFDSTKQEARDKYGTCAGIVGALVDFEIARRATIFAAGHFDLSTFSRAIGDTRLREYGDSANGGEHGSSHDCRSLFFDYNSNRTLYEIFQHQPKPQFWPKTVQWKHSKNVPNARGIGSMILENIEQAGNI